MSMWIPDSSVKTLVDDISEILKYKLHLIADDVRENLEELKTQLEKLRLLMPNFIDNDESDLREMVSEIMPNFIDMESNSLAGRKRYPLHLEWPEMPEKFVPNGPVSVQEMRWVVKDAEDVVDYVYSCCSSRRSILDWMIFKIGQCCSSCQSSLDWMFSMDTRYQISEWIQKAGDEVRSLNEKIMKKGYDQVLHTTKDQDPPQSFTTTAPKLSEDRVVGLDGAAVEVVALLTTGVEHLEFISIVGWPGSGKTTLAKMVYNNEQVQSQYKIRAFVYLSIASGKKACLLKILNSFAQIEDGVAKKMDEDHLEKHIHQQLEGRQYLFVLDDVSQHWCWDSIEGAFPDNKDQRCRVLISHREGQYAMRKYRLDFLSIESSRELLRWKIFGENHCPVELHVYERYLAMICDGYPLALMSVVTMIMKHRDRVEWWKRVAYTLRDYRGKELDHIPKPMYYAYMYLSNHLKPCFLYFAVFPKDIDIPVWKLVRLWIAEGFILGCPHNLEDIAEQYLEELVDLNFVMVSNRRSNGRIGMCKLNAVFYDFCRETAAQESFILELYRKTWHRIISIHDQDPSSWLAICSSEPNFREYMRSLLMFPSSKIELDKKTSSHFAKRFKLLKVLEAGLVYFTCLPYQLWSQILLKYIAISGRIGILPSTLSDLWSLQTLIVDTTSSTLEIKVDLWNMPHFRHLHTNASASFPCKTNGENQENEDCDSTIRTLCYISPECCKHEVFSRTTKLRKLGISGTLSKLFEVNGESSLLEYLHQLEYIENLKLLNWNNSHSLPPKITLPKQLTKITLSNTRLQWKEMHSAIGKMENLEILKLKDYAFLGEQWKTENGGFVRLKHLHIGRTDLKVWEASSDHFPQLGRLEISECDQLRRVPHSLADISSLQSVNLHRSSSHGVTYSLRRIRLVKFLQVKQSDKRKVFEISVFPPQE